MASDLNGPSQDRIDQIVVDWRDENLLGRRGMGPAAASLDLVDKAEMRVLERWWERIRPLTSISSAAFPLTPSLTYVRDERWALAARRVLSTDLLGRPSVRTHALVTTQKMLPLTTALYLGDWRWPAPEGRWLSPVPSGELRGHVANRWQAIEGRGQRCEDGLVRLLAGVLRRELDAGRGASDPPPVFAVVGAASDQIPLTVAAHACLRDVFNWPYTFSTYEIGYGLARQGVQFLFFPAWPDVPVPPGVNRIDLNAEADSGESRVVALWLAANYRYGGRAAVMDVLPLAALENLAAHRRLRYLVEAAHDHRLATQPAKTKPRTVSQRRSLIEDVEPSDQPALRDSEANTGTRATQGRPDAPGAGRVEREATDSAPTVEPSSLPSIPDIPGGGDLGPPPPPGISAAEPPSRSVEPNRLPFDVRAENRLPYGYALSDGPSDSPRDASTGEHGPFGGAGDEHALDLPDFVSQKQETEEDGVPSVVSELAQMVHEQLAPQHPRVAELVHGNVLDILTWLLEGRASDRFIVLDGRTIPLREIADLAIDALAAAVGRTDDDTRTKIRMLLMGHHFAMPRLVEQLGDDRLLSFWRMALGLALEGSPLSKPDIKRWILDIWRRPDNTPTVPVLLAVNDLLLRHGSVERYFPYRWIRRAALASEVADVLVGRYLELADSSVIHAPDTAHSRREPDRSGLHDENVREQPGSNVRLYDIILLAALIVGIALVVIVLAVVA